MATYLYEHVAVWSSCALVVQRLRAHALSSADPACGSSHPTARCSTSVACSCRMVSRTGAAAAGTAARIPSLCCSQGTRFARTSTHCTRSGTMPLRHLCRTREALGRAKRAVVAPLACLGDSITDHVPAHINQTLTPRVAHYLQSWRMYSSQSHSRHSTVDLPSTNLSSIGWGFVLRVLGRARRAGCALR